MILNDQWLSPTPLTGDTYSLCKRFYLFYLDRRQAGEVKHEGVGVDSVVFYGVISYYSQCLCGKEAVLSYFDLLTQFQQEFERNLRPSFHYVMVLLPGFKNHFLWYSESC